MEWFWMKSIMYCLQLPGYASTLLMTHYKSLLTMFLVVWHSTCIEMSPWARFAISHELSLTLPTVSGSDHPNEMFASWAHVFHTSNFTHLPVQVLTVLKHSFALVAQWWSHAQSGRAQVSQVKKFSKRLEAECGYVDWQVHVCSILLYCRRLTMFQCVPMVHGHASNNRNLVLIKLHKKVLNKDLGKTVNEDKKRNKGKANNGSRANCETKLLEPSTTRVAPPYRGSYALAEIVTPFSWLEDISSGWQGN